MARRVQRVQKNGRIYHILYIPKSKFFGTPNDSNLLCQQKFQPYRHLSCPCNVRSNTVHIKGGRGSQSRIRDVAVLHSKRTRIAACNIFVIHHFVFFLIINITFTFKPREQTLLSPFWPWLRIVNCTKLKTHSSIQSESGLF